MRKRILTGACLVLLMGGAAYATDDQTACEAKLSQAEKAVDDKVEAKLLSEGDLEEVNMLLDEADALCTDGKFAEATKTLANVNKLVSAATPASQPGQ
jgi:soluble cytochrome b562